MNNEKNNMQELTSGVKFSHILFLNVMYQSCLVW